jgi:cytochrome b involved in lipid metabolism
MSGVFGWGFIKKQQAESKLKTPLQNQQSQQKDSEKESEGEDGNSSSTNSNTPSTPAPTTNTYTAAEVAKHNSPSNCWLIIHGNVYDVTNFLDQHPGGNDVIIPYCGRDATQAFETQGGRRSTHSQAARDLLAQYQIGTLQ